MSAAQAIEPRWELYRLLGEPMRVRLLAVLAEEELSIGELAELLRESQSNISRHVTQLRRANLVRLRKQGTRVFVALEEDSRLDAVIADALKNGKAMLAEEGLLDRVAALVETRITETRAYFASKQAAAEDAELAAELPAYLHVLASLGPFPKRLVLDAGTGAGRWLDALAPFCERLIALDREQSQLARAEARAEARGYAHIEFMQGDVEDSGVRRTVLREGGADLVIASRLLHHAPKPARTMTALAGLLAPGGALVLIDYLPHDDEEMQRNFADLWLGFSPEELVRYALEAGLVEPEVKPIPARLTGLSANAHSPQQKNKQLVDAHLPWQVLSARKPLAAARAPSRTVRTSR